MRAPTGREDVLLTLAAQLERAGAGHGTRPPMIPASDDRGSWPEPRAWPGMTSPRGSGRPGAARRYLVPWTAASQNAWMGG
jgi:hypothetical protein